MTKATRSEGEDEEEGNAQCPNYKDPKDNTCDICSASCTGSAQTRANPDSIQPNHNLRKKALSLPSEKNKVATMTSHPLIE